jgi:hypothetical protein
MTREKRLEPRVNKLGDRSSIWLSVADILRKFQVAGVPYGNRTCVAAVKEKRFTGIQRKLAAWIAP